MLLMISSTVRMKSAYTVCSAANCPGDARGVAPKKGVAAEGVSAVGVPLFLARLPIRWYLHNDTKLFALIFSCVLQAATVSFFAL